MSADDRAAVVAALDHAAEIIAPDAVVLVADAPVPPGHVCWAVGEMRITLPFMLPTAPREALRRYAAHIRADATGTCPLCGAVATLNADPIDTPAAWGRLPVSISVPHSDGCPALFTEADRPLFDPAAYA